MCEFMCACRFIQIRAGEGGGDRGDDTLYPTTTIILQILQKYLVFFSSK